MSTELLAAVDAVVRAATTPPKGWDAEPGKLWNTQALLDAVEALVRLRQGGVCHVPVEEMREVLRQCWYWFDDHDDRKTGTELHDMLRKVVGS